MIAAFSIALLFAVLVSACGRGGSAVIAFQPGQTAPVADKPGGGPHSAPLLTDKDTPVAKSGWLELFLDEASMSVSLRGYNGQAQWAALPSSEKTPLANAGYCAAEATILANGKRFSLNTQDHCVAYGEANAKPLFAENGEPSGVQVDYLLTPNRQTAAKTVFSKDDVAFLLSIGYYLKDGNFYVDANWSNASGNENAFIESIGLMERFGALRNPGREDFLMLPDGGGALLYPARISDQPGAAETADLRFAVYGEDPGNPVAAQNTADVIRRAENGKALSANVPIYGVRQGERAFITVVEKGAALCDITVKQRITGEADAPLQSAVGPRFTITPTKAAESGNTIYRAANSYNGADEAEGKNPALRLSYRFFYGADNANFNTMATACRERLIGIKLLSPFKSVQGGAGTLPLNLTLLGTGPDGKNGLKTLTTFEQAQDILSRLKNKGTNRVNVCYMGAFSGGWKQAAPEKLSPLMRLNGTPGLQRLQEFCKSKGISLFMDVQLFPAGKSMQALDLTGSALKAVPAAAYAAFKENAQPVPLRSISSIDPAVRSILSRLEATAGISLGDIGNTLYADYAGEGLNREETVRKLDNCLPSLSAQWLVMIDTGYFHVARSADILVNLPLEPQLRMPGSTMEPRYESVPLLPIILHGSADYSGPSLNLAGNSREAFLRSLAYGACPAYTWSFAPSGLPSDNLYFEKQMEDAVNNYTRANTALADLRSERIVSYRLADAGLTVTTFSNDAKLYVNFNDAPKTIEGFTIQPYDFVRN
ncbi:MAG: DUF5696 domain-containing protein [Oscillospiraceae bacterium]|jgi:hypothetical protein|nr:DUF5696 domain-containing protein [Oscillospiraceae bacterium]